MKIEFVRLSKINKPGIISLMNHPLVRRQMPLFNGDFTLADCDAFVAAKEKLWFDFGFGPWAFLVEGQFAGWGGLQPENGEADLALVLHPDFWGYGKIIFQKIAEEAFGPMGLTSFTISLPTTRNKVNGIHRLGFVEEDTVFIKSIPFKRYRITKNT